VIRPCRDSDFDALLAIVNDAAVAYRGVIPDDCWSDPYMPAEELAGEIRTGISFWAYEDGGRVLGMMGLQEVGDVVLIRHAYVRSAHQGRGIGSKLLEVPRRPSYRPPARRHMGRRHLGPPLL
jgi:GNAT superfamily N-acetyltransferase